jgi:hypothetical protein
VVARDLLLAGGAEADEIVIEDRATETVAAAMTVLLSNGQRKGKLRMIDFG